MDQENIPYSTENSNLFWSSLLDTIKPKKIDDNKPSLKRSIYTF